MVDIVYCYAFYRKGTCLFPKLLSVYTATYNIHNFVLRYMNHFDPFPCEVYLHIIIGKTQRDILRIRIYAIDIKEIVNPIVFAVPYSVILMITELGRLAVHCT